MPKIELDRERCKGCLLCAAVCPKGLLARGEEFNGFGFYTMVMTDAKRCTGCALCAETCPDVAIEVWK